MLQMHNSRPPAVRLPRAGGHQQGVLPPPLTPAGCCSTASAPYSCSTARRRSSSAAPRWHGASESPPNRQHRCTAQAPLALDNALNSRPDVTCPECRQREQQAVKLRKTAEQILLNQMKKHLLAAQASQAAESAAQGSPAPDRTDGGPAQANHPTEADAATPDRAPSKAPGSAEAGSDEDVQIVAATGAPHREQHALSDGESSSEGEEEFVLPEVRRRPAALR